MEQNSFTAGLSETMVTYKTKNTRSIKNKVCLITGANSGLGKATALGLAKLGATTLMVCRSEQRGQTALNEIKQLSGNENVVLLIADLSVQDSIRRLVADIKAEYSQLHILINNAAVITTSRNTTKDGIESQFAVNHLAPFLLTTLLLDRLNCNESTRIINLTSKIHRSVDLDFDDLQSKKSYKPNSVYAKTKLANILFTYELDRRLKNTNITINCIHPGRVATNMLTKFLRLPKPLQFITSIVGTDPTVGAESIIYLASSPDVEGMSGKYFVKRKTSLSSPKSYDVQVAKRLWDISEALTKSAF